MKTEPSPEHLWLKKFIGEWTCEFEANMGPDKPCQKFTGTESVKPLGDLWVLFHGHSQSPGGGQMESQITLGFDPSKKRFAGTWVGSMMTHLWVYDGSLDASGKILTLETEGPDFLVPGKIGKYQDVIESVTDDHRTLRSRSLGADGTWNEFMVGHFHRVK